MATRMQQRRANAEQWLLTDPILAAGEIGYETDTTSFKIGDGINTWSLLDYFETSATLSGTIDDYIPLTQKGVALGVAELDANGFVPASQLDLDLTAYYTSAEVDAEISTAVTGLVDSAPGVLDTLNELAAAIGDDADFATTITTSISSGDSATLASAQSYADQAEIDAVATANAYTDAEIAAIPPVDLTGYATETYADDLVGDATVDGTAGNTVTDRIASAVAGIVDTAPEALNTLNELAAALGDDADFATTVTTSLGNKQDKVAGISDTEIGYLNGVTSGIQEQIDANQSKLIATKHALKTSSEVITGNVIGTITPISGLTIQHALSSASNKLLITGHFGSISSTGGQNTSPEVAITVTSDSTPIAVGDSEGSAAQLVLVGGRLDIDNNNANAYQLSFSFVYEPGDTNNHTYDLCTHSITNNKDIYINRVISTSDLSIYTRTTASFVIQEVSA